MTSRAPRRPASLLLVGLVLALSGSACSSGGSAPSAAPPYQVVGPAALRPGDPVPVPQGEVVLTVTGDISNPNVGDTLQLDLATLEQLGLVEYSVDDQQAEGRVVTFQGVLASDLLAVAGAADTAETLVTTALNDYAVDIPVSDVRDYPVMIATSVDGERMPVERYGPTRIVYPYGAYEIDQTLTDPRWIWQLATIDVR